MLENFKIVISKSTPDGREYKHVLYLDDLDVMLHKSCLITFLGEHVVNTIKTLEVEMKIDKEIENG